MKHVVEGILIKYNEPWFNGVRILPGAFDAYNVSILPMWADFESKETIVGWARLRYEKDGVYYTGSICKDDVIQKCLDDGLDLGMFANKIEWKDEKQKTVRSAKLLGMAFTPIPDGAAKILTIDGMKVAPRQNVDVVVCSDDTDEFDAEMEEGPVT